MISVGAISQAAPLRQAAARPTPAQKTAGDDGVDLSEEARRLLSEMKARDREVRSHEQAHKTAGGPYVGAISYEFEKGPDGRHYAVSGEVPIDATPVAGDPEATIAKMEVVIAAALAPPKPSPQDRAVASRARAQLVDATADLRADRAEARAAQVAAARRLAEMYAGSVEAAPGAPAGEAASRIAIIV